MPTTPTEKPPAIPLDRVITLISDKTRWRIFAELLDGGALPRIEIARRIQTPATNVSKHLKVMVEYGAARQVLGRLYQLVPGLARPEEHAIDFGSALLRLDHVQSKSK
jgi:hypothetical protein